MKVSRSIVIAFAAAYRKLPVFARRALVKLVTPGFTVGAVVGILNERNEILMVRQRHRNGWALPGGLLRRGEDPVDALKRELREELSIEWGSGETYDFAVTDPSAQRIDLVWVTDESVPNPIPDGLEVTAFGWRALAEQDCSAATRRILVDIARLHRDQADGQQ